jgi:hypothetical protein
MFVCAANVLMYPQQVLASCWALYEPCMGAHRTWRICTKARVEETRQQRGWVPCCCRRILAFFRARGPATSVASAAAAGREVELSKLDPPTQSPRPSTDLPRRSDKPVNHGLTSKLSKDGYRCCNSSTDFILLKFLILVLQWSSEFNLTPKSKTRERSDRWHTMSSFWQTELIVRTGAK